MESPEGSSKTWKPFLQLKEECTVKIFPHYFTTRCLNGERKMPDVIIEMKKIWQIFLDGIRSDIF